MMRLRQIKRLILPVILVAVSMAVPGLLQAAKVRRVKHQPAHKAHLHPIPPRHVSYVRSRRKLKHAVPSRRAKRKYHPYHYHRYRPRRVVRFRFGPSSNRIDQIQEALVRAGFYQGDPSGMWNSQTVDAMKSFQQAHGLAPTGKIDATTLQQLGLGSDIAGLAPPRPLIAANGPGPSE